MKKLKRILCLALAAVMALMTSACKNKSEQETKAEPVNITVYTDGGGFSGVMDGWSGQLLKDRFNVTITIKYVEDFASGKLYDDIEDGDIFIFFTDAADSAYYQAVQKGLLMDFDDNTYIEKYGKNILNYERDMMAENRLVTSEITGGASDACYGLYGFLGADGTYNRSYNGEWDVRWDLYKELGYPQVKDLDDLAEVLKAMQELCPKNSDNRKTYALSLANSYDCYLYDYICSVATGYYGYPLLCLGLYDPETWEYHELLKENGEYLTVLKFLNKLYQNDLLDPGSYTQDVDEVYEKVRDGRVLCQASKGYDCFNTDENMAAGQYMCALIPEDTVGIMEQITGITNPRIISIGANSKYPELSTKIIDYFVSPEGFLELTYGPKGILWDMDKDGLPILTDFSIEQSKEHDYFCDVVFEYDGNQYAYDEGTQMFNFFTWYTNSLIPGTDEKTTFDYRTWKNYTVIAKYPIQQDWMDYTGACDTFDYFNKMEKVRKVKNTIINLGDIETGSSDGWNAVVGTIVDYSWKAVYADTDEKFDAIVAEMKEAAIEAGYNEFCGYDRKILAEAYAAEHGE